MAIPKDDELVKGGLYLIRLTDGSWKTGEFMYERQTGGGNWGRRMTHYVFQNLKTGRLVEIKSRQRISYPQPA